MHSFRPWTFVLLTSLSLACAAEDTYEPLETDVEARASRIGGCRGCVWGPPVLNTNEVNGLPTPAIDLSGAKWNGMELQFIEIGGDPTDTLDSLWLDDGSLRGVGASGVEYAEGDFVGAAFVFTDHRLGFGPIETRMSITSYKPDGVFTRYGLDYVGHNPGEGPQPTCALDQETGEQTAVIMQDVNVESDGTVADRPDTLYFACTSGAIGKAPKWGYARWDVGPDLFQTITRSVMADYCGDGTSYTAVGTPLQVEDDAGVRGFPKPEAETEVIWGPDGAECLLDPRLSHLDYGDIQCANRSIPMCDPQETIGDYPGALAHTKIWPL